MSDPPRPADTDPPLTQGGPARAPARGREGGPVLAGVLTGLLLAVLWTLFVYLVHQPVSLAGWGVGGLIGIALAKAAPAPSRALGTLGALLTVGTVVLAKTLILAFALRPIVTDEFVRNHTATTLLYVVDMRKHRTFSPTLQAALDEQERRHADTTRALRGFESGFELSRRVFAEARARDSQATRAEREQLVEIYADSLIAREGFLPMLGRLFGFWDGVWLLFGVSSAWKLAQSGPG